MESIRWTNTLTQRFSSSPGNRQCQRQTLGAPPCTWIPWLFLLKSFLWTNSNSYFFQQNINKEKCISGIKYFSDIKIDSSLWRYHTIEMGGTMHNLRLSRAIHSHNQSFAGSRTKFILMFISPLPASKACSLSPYRQTEDTYLLSLSLLIDKLNVLNCKWWNVRHCRWYIINPFKYWRITLLMRDSSQIKRKNHFEEAHRNFRFQSFIFHSI